MSIYKLSTKIEDKYILLTKIEQNYSLNGNLLVKTLI
jgi:hypothetical protein